MRSINVNVGDESAFGLKTFSFFSMLTVLWCNKHGDMAKYTETKGEKRCSSQLSKWEMMVPLGQGCQNLGFLSSQAGFWPPEDQV